jgi:hypothetical protein
MQQPYSTLEVHSTEHAHGVAQQDRDRHLKYSGFLPSDPSNYPQVVSHDHLQYPEVAPDVNEKVLIPAESDKEAWTAWSGSEQPEIVQHLPVNPQNADLGQGTAASHAENTPSRNQTCGVSRKRFWIILCVFLLFVVGAIVGAVAGVLVSRSHADAATNQSAGSGSQGNATGTVITNILSNSSMTAVNFTDPDGYKHRMVFFEDGYNSIVARRWDSQNSTWATSNISLVMSNSPTPVDIEPGAALAATAVGHQVELFLVDASGMIRSLFNSDFLTAPDRWQNYTMNDTLSVYPGSRLAATVQACGSNNTFCSCNLDFCTAGWAIAYQRPGDGAVITTNYSSAWAGRQVAVYGNDATAATSLNLLTEYLGDTDRMALVSQRYVSGTEGAVVVTGYNAHAWDPLNGMFLCLLCLSYASSQCLTWNM